MSVTSGVPEDTTRGFADVYEQHAARVYRYCLSQLSSRADAEDIAAEVFAAAYRAYRAEDLAGDTVLPWLLRVARNAIIDHRRRHSRRSARLRRLLAGTTEADPAVDVAGEVVFRDEIRRVLAAMRHLSDRDRTIIGLRVAAGLPHAEVGAVLGISEQAATMATTRALGKLRRHLELS